MFKFIIYNMLQGTLAFDREVATKPYIAQGNRDNNNKTRDLGTQEFAYIKHFLL